MSDYPGGPQAYYPPPVPGAGQPYPLPGPPPPARTNGFAIASLILGLTGFFGLPVILSAIFGFVALSQIRQQGGKGRGMAIAGLVLSGLWTVALIAGIVLAVVFSAGRGSTGEITKAGSLSIDDLKTGDCVDGVRDGVVITTVTARPCADPHDSEVFSQFTLPDGSWPGADAVAVQAQTQCTDSAAQVLAGSPMIDRLSLFILYPPDAPSWDRSRSVSCLVIDINGGKLTGKAAG